MSARLQMPERRRRSVTAMLMLALGALGGCGNLSGLDGGSKYACKAPEGVTCDSVSGTYANTLYKRLPSQGPQPGTGEGTPPPASAPSAAPRRLERAAPPAIAGTPTTGHVIPALRSQARVLRLWTQAWEDMDGDLHDQGYVYVQVSSGQWMIEHVQSQIRDAHAPSRQTARAPEPAGKTGSSMGRATDASEGPREPSDPTSQAFPGRPAVGMPAASSFNRVQ